MTTKKTATQRKTPTVNPRTKPDRLPAIFNERYPLGSVVAYRPSKGSDYEFFPVRGSAYMNQGEPVAFLEGQSGFVSIRPEFIDYDFQDDTKPAAVPDDNAAADVAATEPDPPADTRTAAEMMADADPDLFTPGEAAFVIESIDGPRRESTPATKAFSERIRDRVADSRVERAINESITIKLAKIEKDLLKRMFDEQPKNGPLPEPDSVIGTATVLHASGMFEPLTIAQIATYILAGRDLIGAGPILAVTGLEFVDGQFLIKRSVIKPDDEPVAQRAENRSWGNLDEARATSADGDGPFHKCKNCGWPARDHVASGGGCPELGGMYEAVQPEPESATWGDGRFVGDLDGGAGISIEPTPAAKCEQCGFPVVDHSGHICPVAITETPAETFQDPGDSQPTSIDDAAERVADLEPAKENEFLAAVAPDYVAKLENMPVTSIAPTGPEMIAADRPSDDCPGCGLPVVLCDCRTRATPEPTSPADNAVADVVDDGESRAEFERDRAGQTGTDLTAVQAANAEIFDIDPKPANDGPPPPDAFDAIPVPDDRKASGFYTAPNELPLPAPYPHNPTTWRNRIGVMCRHLGIDPVDKLAKFDAAPTSPAKLEYYETVTEYYSKYWPEQLVRARERALQG